MSAPAYPQVNTYEEVDRAPVVNVTSVVGLRSKGSETAELVLSIVFLILGFFFPPFWLFEVIWCKSNRLAAKRIARLALTFFGFANFLLFLIAVSNSGDSNVIVIYRNGTVV